MYSNTTIKFKYIAYYILFVYIIFYLHEYGHISEFIYDILYRVFNFCSSKFPAIIVLSLICLVLCSQESHSYPDNFGYGYMDMYDMKMHKRQFQMYKKKKEVEEKSIKEISIPKLSCEYGYQPGVWFTEEDKEDLKLLREVEEKYKTSLTEDEIKKCQITLNDVNLGPEDLKAKKENVENMAMQEECEKYSFVWNEVNRIKKMHKTETFKDCNNNLIVNFYG